jgi:hypothetical protein
VLPPCLEAWKDLLLAKQMHPGIVFTYCFCTQWPSFQNQ